MSSKTITILSYNIHKGLSATNLRHILPNIKKMLQSVGPDIVFLQEVIGHHEDDKHALVDWESRAQFEYLADSIWHHFAYGQNAVYQAGHHGNAILSKFPIINYSNHDITTNKYESRGVLHATVEDPTDKSVIQLFCTHFDLFEKGRKLQCQKLLDILRPYQQLPLIVAGDFNDIYQTGVEVLEQAGLQEAYKVLHKRLPKTFPCAFPLVSLDRVFVKNFRPLSAQVLRGKEWARLSDHAALLCQLEML